MRKISIIALLVVFGGGADALVRPAPEAVKRRADGGVRPSIRFDHLFILVQPNAPERAALEKAGFRVEPAVNQHDGQGTASVMAEFQDGFIELMWVDPSVPVAPGAERANEKFRKRVEWRTSGWSPFGINLSRTKPGVDPPYPFPTWTISMPWMEPGTSIVVLTSRDDTKSPSVSVHPHATKQSAGKHPNGAKRITHVRIVTPPDYEPAPAMLYARDQQAIELAKGDAWCAEITFDGGKKGKRKDLRPELPLVVRY